MTAEVYAEDGYYAVIPEWVLDADVSAQAIRLYAVLRRYADQRTMHAHPSRRTLAGRLQVADVKVVDRALADLRRIGAVSVIARITDDGDRTSNSYMLHRAPVPQGGGSDAIGVQNGGGGGSDATTGWPKSPDGGGVSTLTVGAQTGEEPQPGNHSQEPQTEIVGPDPFDQFWTAYPRKVGKVAARRAWTSAVRKAKPAAILAAVGSYPFSTELRFVPHPASWLNGCRWEDDRAAVNPAAPGAVYRDPDPGDYHAQL